MKVPPTSKETSRENSRETSKEITPKQREIISIIKETPYITASELARLLNITEKGVRFHLRNLKKLGVVERVNSTKSGYWEVK